MNIFKDSNNMKAAGRTKDTQRWKKDPAIPYMILKLCAHSQGRLFINNSSL